jgi:hypothetical protein
MASTLDKMGLNEITEMIDFRWRVASGNQTHPFTSDAIQSIYNYSDGIPREACILADNSLLLAFLQKKLEIGKDIVEIAVKDRVDNIGSARKLEPRAEHRPKPKDKANGKPANSDAKEVITHG